MADCRYCKPSEHVLFEDDEVIAMLSDEPATEGHALVMPKQHIAIFEQVPDKIANKLFAVANKVSNALFDSMQAQGTNLFVTNGVAAGQSIAHFAIHVLPRKENDGIDLQWQPRQLSEEEMATIELKLKEKPTPKQGQVKAKEPVENNYYWKSWNRRLG